MPQIPMTVCQTCGVEGYTNLLIDCVQCKIVAVHRYCIDGPPSVDDDEVIWSCEDCVPRKPESLPEIRKSERVHLQVDREAACRKARRNWRNNLSTPKVEKLNCVGNIAKKVADDASNLDKNKSRSVRKRANEVADDTSHLDEKKNGIVKRKQGKLKENGIARYRVSSKTGGSKPAPLIRQKKKILNSDDDAKKKPLEPSLFTGQKTKDLDSNNVDDENPEAKVEKNLGPQLSKEPDHSLERTFNTDERRDGDSVAEMLHKHEQSFSEIHSSLLEEQLKSRSYPAAEQPDGADYKISDNIEETKAVSDSHQRGDKQSHVNICELQTSRKKRRLVIAMEFSDSDEEPIKVKAEDPQIAPEVKASFFHMSNAEPPVKMRENDLAQRSFVQPEEISPTQLSPKKSDNHVLTQTTSMDFVCPVISQLSPTTFGNYVPAQPIINAVWRGYCSIRNDVRLSPFGLEAHLSTKAHGKVHGAASALPNLLSFELVEKHCAWPKSFEKSPPTGDKIGLYFFPVDERDEKWYEYLLDEMIDCDLVLKCHINNLELLVFSSQKLPREERRFQSKYYLWGVFKQKQETSLTTGQPDIQTNDSMYHTNTCRSSASPSSVGNSSNSHGHHEAGKHFVELAPSIISKHPKPPASSSKQGYSSPLKSSDSDNLAWRNEEDRNSRKSRKPQAYARGSRDVKYPYHEGGSNVYKRTHESRQRKPVKNWKDSQFRRSSHSHSSYRSHKY